MKPRQILVVSIWAALVLSGAAPQARAQQTTSVAAPDRSAPPVPQRVRRRIEINPRPLLYRRCIDWYELQHRPSGTVLYPQMRCWWVRG